MDSHPTRKRRIENDTSTSVMEGLPKELVWMLIEYAPETVHDLRLTSRLLSHYVDAYTSQRSIIPLVSSLNMEVVPTRERNSEKMTITLHIHESKANLFELRVKLLADFLTTIMKCTITFKSIKYEIDYLPNTNNEIMLEYLKKCIGVRIGKVGICEIFPFPIYFNKVSKVFEGTTFECLSIGVPLSSKTADYILSTIKLHNVAKLSLLVHNPSIFNPVKFLLDVSELVGSMQIYQYRMKELASSDNYLFGMLNADWSSIIIDMFSRKLDNLRIQNYNYTDYLTPDELISRLPWLGKKIWFSSSCKKYERAFDEIRNSHHVKVVGPQLIIKHRSLRDEIFSWLG